MQFLCVISLHTFINFTYFESFEWNNKILLPRLIFIFSMVFAMVPKGRKAAIMSAA